LTDFSRARSVHAPANVQQITPQMRDHKMRAIRPGRRDNGDRSKVKAVDHLMYLSS
jgi:hypothetical protein